MANRKPTGSDASEVAPDSTASSLARIANLLALLALKGESQTDKMVTLGAAGFSVQEIAALLRTTPNNVSVQMHRIRKQGSKR